MEFWSDARLNRFGVALLLGVALAVAAYASRPYQENSAFFSGDFPGFYAPAVILKEGRHEQLYDRELQKNIQASYWPEFRESFYIFAYPPYTALVLQPLALLTPVAAKAVFELLNFSFVMLAALVLAGVSKLPYCFVLGFSLCFAPLLFASLGSQMSGLVLLLSIPLLGDSTQRKMQIVQGVSVGLLLVKPQYAILAAVWLIVKKKPVALGSFCLVAAAYYGWAASEFGLAWPWQWLREVNSFGEVNYFINAFQMVSLFGLLYDLLGILGFRQDLLLVLAPYSFPLAILIAIPTAAALNRSRLPEIWSAAVFVALIPILAPQSLFYDFALVLPVLFLLMRARADIAWIGITSAAALALSVFFRGAGFGTLLMTLFLLSLGSLAVRQSLRARS